MKYFYTALLLLFTVHGFAQKMSELVSTGAGEYVKTNDAIIYSSFIGRHLSFMKSGYEQAVVLRNTDTKELFLMHDLGYGKSKSYLLSYHLNPGNYEIVYFKWAEGKWYGATIHTELIFKNVDSADSLVAKIKSGLIKTDTLKRFKFTVAAGNLYYLGTWDFSKGIAAFTNDKPATDKRMKEDYFILDFDKSITQLPHTD